MLKTKTTVQEKPWTLNLRTRVGDAVTHDSNTWVNITGKNSEPGVGTDWEVVLVPNYFFSFGTLSFYKANGNILNSLEAGDTVIGQLNNSLFLTRGVYVAGDKMEITSYDQNISDWFNPNE